MPDHADLFDRAAMIFERACALPAAERPAFLDEACDGDARIREEIESMLGARADQGDFLAEPTGAIGPPVTAMNLAEQPGTVIDRYRLLQLIGEGGFGAVYMAEQKEPVRRKVALKIIKLGMDTRQVIARFEAERQALAIMDHPNIAKVLDAGATESGRPYFVMELVRGVPITDYCDSENLSVRARLELMIQVCGAVQHAHQKGIIHRDIKPSNVMVTIADGKPIPKVIDFGIAKATNQDLTDKTLFTEYKQIIGTPEYMSPEQAEMRGIDIDTRSDVYSLGVLLYELLTGTTPFDARTLREAGYAEMQRIIREEEPPRPSTRLSTLGTDSRNAARRRRGDAGDLPSLIRGDLDWIVMKALEKDRGRRYETAHGLARDIERHLADEPVFAGPPRRLYRLQKFVRRNRAGVIAAAVVVLGLFTGLGLATAGLVIAWRSNLHLEDIKNWHGVTSMAVVPLEAKSAEQAYLADGLTAFLAEDLSHISALRVVGDQSVRSAVRRLGDDRSHGALAEELRVNFLLTGDVETSGDHVRLQVRLIHAPTGREIWQRPYSEELRRLEVMQHDVSSDVTDFLRLELTAKERERLASAREVDPRAQTACMKGLHLLNKQNRDSLLRAQAYFDEAIGIDPDFAAAHAGHAMTNVRMENQFAPPLAVMPSAKESALRAIELDDSLAEAHTALGYVNLQFDWDWAAAEQAFATAIDRNPNYADGYVGYAMYLAAIGETDEVRSYVDKALEVDPFALLTTSDGILIATFMSGDYERTIQLCRAAIELDPNTWMTHSWMGLALAYQGRVEEAVVAAERAEEIAAEHKTLNPDDAPAPYVYAVLGWVYAVAGRTDEARDAIDVMQRHTEERFVCPYEMATVHIALGELEQAMELLQEAIDVRSSCIPWLTVDPRLEPVRPDERFEGLLEQSGHDVHLRG